MAEIISTVDIKETLTAGKDKNLEVKVDQDHPMVTIDQSKVCSTRNIVPNKRPLAKKDIKRFLVKVKGEKKKVEQKNEEKEIIDAPKRGRPKK